MEGVEGGCEEVGGGDRRYGNMGGKSVYDDDYSCLNVSCR